MRIELTASGVALSDDETEQVQRRVLLSLARFGDLIQRVHGRCALAAPTGEANFNLTIVVETIGTLQADASSHTLVDAVGIAADRLHRAVARRLDNLNPNRWPLQRR